MGAFWSTGVVQAQPGLPRGWSFPIEPSEVEDYFPGVGHVHWSLQTTTSEGSFPGHIRSLRVAWEPRVAEPPSVLTVFAVPSDHLIEIRKWIGAVVGPESRAWMRALESQNATWLLHGHAMH